MTTRYLVCGGRDVQDYDMVDRALRVLIPHPERSIVIHGAARGVDTLAATWARSNRVPEVIACPADWETYKKAAGPIRNREMLEQHRPDVVIAFPGGPGTRDMVKRANAMRELRNATGGPPLVVIEVTA